MEAAPGIVRAQALSYVELFAEKPFREAVLLYFSNGAYKIVSPGEDHYGSYVAEGPLDGPTVRVHFISWPSTDWGENVVYHSLLFDRLSGAFSQHLIRPGDPFPKLQTGYARLLDDATPFTTATTWAEAAALARPTLDALAHRPVERSAD